MLYFCVHLQFYNITAHIKSVNFIFLTSNRTQSINLHHLACTPAITIIYQRYYIKVTWKPRFLKLPLKYRRVDCEYFVTSLENFG